MKNNNLRLLDSSAASQRQLILLILEQEGPTTVQALQRKYGILDPRPRVCELRWKFGKNIKTTRKQIKDKFGNERIVGEYALLRGKWEGKNVKD